MPNLTELQQAFVVAYTSDPTAIGNCREAALRAGYSQHTAAESGRRLVTQPHIRSAIRAANLELISGRIATKAVALLERVIDDESAPVKIRVDAAKTILDRGGFGAAPAGQGDPNEKHASEMTEAELYQRMIELRKIVDSSRESTIIDVTPQPEALPVANPEGIDR
jgi:phage terminase small subunit